MANVIVTTRSGEVVELVRLDVPSAPDSVRALVRDLQMAVRLADHQDQRGVVTGLGLRVRMVTVKRRGRGLGRARRAS